MKAIPKWLRELFSIFVESGYIDIILSPAEVAPLLIKLNHLSNNFGLF